MIIYSWDIFRESILETKKKKKKPQMLIYWFEVYSSYKQLKFMLNEARMK